MGGWRTILAAAVLATCAATLETHAAEGFDPALRAEVEALTTSGQPTDAGNVGTRARTAWAWANALARSGTELPVDLTAVVGAALNEPNEIVQRALDAYIGELELLDETPGALGELTADTGPFEARTFVTIRQTWRAGSRTVGPGGGFMVARHFMADLGALQIDDPKGDNYVTVSSSNADVSFAADRVPMTGMHGGFRGASPNLVFRVATGRLAEGDTVTITYGDRTHGSRGILMAHFSSDRMPLPVYLAFEANGHFHTLPIQPVRVGGGPVARVTGFAPSVVGTNEEFTLAVRAGDLYYNRATGTMPAWRVTWQGRHVKNIDAGGSPITLVNEVVFPEPGVYRLDISSADGAITGQSNPILVSRSPERRIYWGDTHGHSGFAEGIGTPDRFMSWARDDARLDFVTHSEHDVWLDDAEWEVLRDNVRRYTREGEFIAYLGYEWTVGLDNGGHHNVLFRSPEGRERVAAQFYPTLAQLYAGLRAGSRVSDVVVIPHAHQAGDWTQSDADLEPLVEIMSQHGNFEWFGRMYLAHGHRVGFTAASDNHLSQPGYSAPQGGSLSQRGGLGAVLAAEHTTDAIFDAMKNLRTYATSGERIILDVELNGVGMGGVAPHTPTRVVRGRVIGTAPIDTVTLVKNDATVWQQDLLTHEFDRLPKKGRFQLAFASDSQPLVRDNPRGWRPWRGTLEVGNATLTGVRGTDFASVLLQSLEVDAANPNRVHFETFSRGDASAIELDLEGVRRTTTIAIKLEEAVEFGGAPPIHRPQATLPAAELEISLHDLERGRLTVMVENADYIDRIELRTIVEDGPLETTFEFEDPNGAPGDWYYVRVVQANDAKAWSSPIRVAMPPANREEIRDKEDR